MPALSGKTKWFLKTWQGGRGKQPRPLCMSRALGATAAVRPGRGALPVTAQPPAGSLFSNVADGNTVGAHAQPSNGVLTVTTMRKESHVAEGTGFAIPPALPREETPVPVNSRTSARRDLLHKSVSKALPPQRTTTTNPNDSKEKKLAKHLTISCYMPVNKAGPLKPNNWMGKYDRRLKIE